MKKLLLTLAFLLPTLRVQAMEVSLEENRAERGNIGYVDMQKIFTLYPETSKAKQSFSEIVRQAEEQVNLKKAELLTLRAEISKLNMERVLIQKTPIPATEPKPKPEPKPEPAPAPKPEESASLTPGSTEFANLPGMSRPVEEPKPAPAPPKLEEPVQKAVNAGKNARAQELDDTVAARVAELAQKEADFKEYQAQVEKQLKDLEARRSEALLEKIYGVIRDVAKENNVSVIVDKSQIVFGHDTVDLTAKVIKKLEAKR